MGAERIFAIEYPLFSNGQRMDIVVKGNKVSWKSKGDVFLYKFPTIVIPDEFPYYSFFSNQYQKYSIKKSDDFLPKEIICVGF